VLEAEGLHVAAVSAIAGQTRLTLTFRGRQTTPEPRPCICVTCLAAAAEWITVVEALARKADGLVATVGRVSVEPNAGNVVPGLVQVSLDVRHSHDEARSSVSKNS